jgi:hypothetical protein
MQNKPTLDDILCAIVLIVFIVLLTNLKECKL